MQSLRNYALAAIAALALVIATFGQAQAAEVTLKAASYTPVQSLFTKQFRAFVDKVNAEGKGLVQINFLGGAPKVMSVLEMGGAVSKGIIDMASISCVFCLTQFPTATATFFTGYDTQEMRENGTFEVMRELYVKHMKVHYLARTNDRLTLSLFMNKPVSKIDDFKGMKIRTSPLHSPFVNGLGATAIEMRFGDTYSGLERGLVVGYAWPTMGVFDFGLQDVTKYRVEPEYYLIDMSLLVNLNTWNKLDEEQQDFLHRMALWIESTNKDGDVLNISEKKRQDDYGFKLIRFEGDECRKYVRIAYDAAWDGLRKRDAATTDRLKKLLYDEKGVIDRFCTYK